MYATDHTAETQFQKALQALRLKSLEMAARTERALGDSILALRQRDADLAQSIIERDCEINEMQVEVDEKSLMLLALEQPMAKDLRFIVGTIHVASNLERIADQAVNIAERAVLFSQRSAMQPYPLFDNLLETVSSMVSDAVIAYNRADTELALSVCRRDAEVDSTDIRVLKHYIDYSQRESLAVESSVHMIILSKTLERIGDLSTNIAEHVLFIVEGVNVKSTCHRT